jgi:hypothetical protein
MHFYGVPETAVKFTPTFRPTLLKNLHWESRSGPWAMPGHKLLTGATSCYGRSWVTPDHRGLSGGKSCYSDLLAESVHQGLTKATPACRRSETIPDPGVSTGSTSYFSHYLAAPGHPPLRARWEDMSGRSG